MSSLGDSSGCDAKHERPTTLKIFMTGWISVFLLGFFLYNFPKFTSISIIGVCVLIVSWLIAGMIRRSWDNWGDLR